MGVWQKRRWIDAPAMSGRVRFEGWTVGVLCKEWDREYTVEILVGGQHKMFHHVEANLDMARDTVDGEGDDVEVRKRVSIRDAV